MGQELTSEESRIKLENARRNSLIINVASGVIFVWVMFFPQPYNIIVPLAMIVPIVAIGVVYFHAGLVKINEEKGTVNPSIVYAFVFPSLAVMLRAAMDYDIFYTKDLWIITAVFALTLMSVLFFAGTHEFNLKKTQGVLTTIAISLFIYCYSFGSFVMTNCLFDKSEPSMFQADIVTKSYTDGIRHDTFYLELSPWGPREQSEKVSVSEEQYDQARVGDKVSVYLKSGLLKTQWFYLTID